MIREMVAAALALTLVLSAWAIAAGPTTGPATQPVIEVAAYVPGATVTLRRGLSVVIEVTNHTDEPIQVGNHPLVEKVFKVEVRPFAPPSRLPARRGDQPLILHPKVRTAYPNTVELLGVDITGRIRQQFVTCQPGQSVLVKVEVVGIFQPGDCQLLVSLMGPSPAVGSGPEVARAQPIDLIVVKAEGK